MKKFKIYFYLIIVFNFSFISPCYAFFSSFFSAITPELLVNVGQSNHRTKMQNGEIVRTRYGFMGYHLDFFYRHEKYSPYITLEGYKLFGSNKTIKSSKFVVGAGLKYIRNEDYYFLFDVTRIETQYYLSNNFIFQEKRDVFFNFGILAFLKLREIKNGPLNFYFGGGVNFPQDDEKLLLKNGNFQQIGLRLDIPIEDTNESYIFKAGFGRYLVRSPQFHDNQYTVGFLAGKSF